MQFLKNVNIGHRLALAFGFVFALMVFIVAVGLLGLRNISTSAESFIREDYAANDVLADLRIHMLQLRRDEKDIFINLGDAETMQKYRKSWDSVQSRMDDEIQKLRALAKPLHAEEQLNDLRQGLKSYKDVFAKVDDDARAGRLESTKAANKAMAPAKEGFHAAEKAARAINERIGNHAAAQGAAVTAASKNATMWMSGSALMAVLAGAAFGLAISRSITRPIREAVGVAQAVAGGNLTSRIEVTSRDETGQLLESLKTMNDNLTRIVEQVRTSSDSIAVGSGQIAMGNADLSHRTEEQASNLEETAASMEQLTSAVQSTAGTARQADQLAGAASNAAAKGGEVMNQVIATMEDMAASSRKIADITGVIDSIAFQTNILALNAAVEAARAGEQGRGFAVVASEVRSLAQRSANAAKEIKALIGASVEKVENGAKLIDGAGQAMEDIVGQVQRMGHLISEMSSASTEQSTGIEHVGVAVQHLDQATQQNAALVEQNAAATESLKQQASRLSDTVRFFKLA